MTKRQFRQVGRQTPTYPSAEDRRKRLLAAGIAAFALSASGCGQFTETTGGVAEMPQDAGLDAGFDAGPETTGGVAPPPDDGGPISCPIDAGTPDVQAPGGAAPLPDAGD